MTSTLSIGVGNSRTNFDGVHGYLEGMANIRQFHGLPPGFEELVLRHGRPWPIIAKTLPDGVRPGIIKQCFMNSGRLAIACPARFTYVEGYAAGVIPVLHAWVVDNDGTVIDPTWCQRKLGPGTEYIGIPFRTSALLEMTRTTWRWGLIDSPPDFPLLFLPENEMAAMTDGRFDANPDGTFAIGGAR